MKLRKQRSAEEIRRRKGIDAFLGKIGKGFKQLGTEYLTPASKVGGALRSAYRGEPLDITDEDVLAATMFGVGAGWKGGLPAGAVGTGISTKEALYQLGKSAREIRVPFGPKETLRQVGTHTRIRSDATRRLPAKNVRKMAAAIRQSPAKILEPLDAVKYHQFTNPKTAGSNPRILGTKRSSIQLSPDADVGVWFHELDHSDTFANIGKRDLKGYLSWLLEHSSGKASNAVEKARRLGKIGKKDTYYFDKSIERHARNTSAETLDGASQLSGDLPLKEYNRIFNREAKRVLKNLKKEWPTLYKETLKDAAKSYKREAAFKRYVKEGIQAKRPPGTFNEWYEGLVKSPKSKVTKPGLPMKTDDIIKLIKKLPEREARKIKIKRKAD